MVLVKRLCDEAGIGFVLEQNARGVVARFGRPDWQLEYAHGEDKPAISLSNNVGVTKETAGSSVSDGLLLTSGSTINSTKHDQLTKRERDVLLFIASHPDANQQRMAEELGVDRGTISRHVMSLQAKGYLRREGSRKKGTWVVINPEELGI